MGQFRVGPCRKREILDSHDANVGTSEVIRDRSWILAQLLIQLSLGSTSKLSICYIKRLSDNGSSQQGRLLSLRKGLQIRQQRIKRNW
jgi:hypothetical protein